MGISKQPTRGYGHLWKANDTPTECEEVQVRSQIYKLKAEFEQLAGRPWIANQDTTHTTVLSKKVRKVHEAIRQHLQLLSSTRRVPAEIWQKIFEIALLDIENQHPRNPYDKALRALCRVCKLWDAAAKGDQSLWTKFPTFEFGDSRLVSTPLRNRDQGRTLRRLEQYIAQSGTRPITFGYILHHERYLLGTYVAFAYTVLKQLVKESHRWEGAALYFARDGDERQWPEEHLAPIKGNVPVLRSLDLTVAASSALSWSKSSTVPSLFSDAPKLRHVMFNSPRTTRGALFDIELPWSQLESFEGLCHTNDSFGRLLSLSGNTLTSLKCDVRSLLTSPTTAVTMHNLTTLNIRFFSRGDIAYLLFLTLPLLSVLELHGDGYDDSIPVYRILRHLIRDSRCSLKRLVVALRLPSPGAGTFQDLQGLLLECPLLTELDIRSSYLFNSQPGARLNPLFTPDTGKQVTPHLRTLTLRSDPRDSDWVVDPLELMKMFISRPTPTINGCCSLEEIHLEHSPHEGVSAWSSQLDPLDHSTLEAFGPTDINHEVSAEWGAGLLSLIRAPSNPVSVGPLNIKRHHDLMKRMEDLELDDCDLRILARQGIVHSLSLIGRREEGAISGDKLFHFRKRAAALCEKWRPHLLRNYKMAPLRWYRINNFSAKLVCVPPAPRESDDDLWARILGYSPETNKQSEPKEPWRSVTLLDGYRDEDTFLREAIERSLMR